VLAILQNYASFKPQMIASTPNIHSTGDTVMGFLAVDWLLTAIVAVAVVLLVLLGNELYFRHLRRRGDEPSVRQR
jgi:disulfide bond formation protein DsbB